MSHRDAYIEKAQAKIDEYSAKLDQLKAQAKGKQADEKIEAQRNADKLEAEIQAAKQRINEWANATEDNPQDVSSRFKTLADDLDNSFRKFFN